MRRAPKTANQLDPAAHQLTQKDSHSSSSVFCSAGAGSRLRFSPNWLTAALFFGSALPLSNISLTLLESPDPILDRREFSPPPASSALCFFKGLPRNSPFNAVASLDASGAPVTETEALGGVVDSVDVSAAVSPVAGLSVDSSLALPANGSEDACRLSYFPVLVRERYLQGVNLP